MIPASSSLGRQPCLASKHKGCHRSQIPQQSGEGRWEKRFHCISSKGQTPSLQLRSQAIGPSLTLSPTPPIQLINDSFWFYLQDIPRMQCSQHLRHSHSSPSPHVSHLDYVNDILSGSMVLPFCPMVHTGLRVTVQNSTLMQLSWPFSYTALHF